MNVIRGADGRWYKVVERNPQSRYPFIDAENNWNGLTVVQRYAKLVKMKWQSDYDCEGCAQEDLHKTAKRPYGALDGDLRDVLDAEAQRLNPSRTGQYAVISALTDGHWSVFSIRSTLADARRASLLARKRGHPQNYIMKIIAEEGFR